MFSTLGKILVNDIHFTKFVTKVFPHQNFVLYSLLKFFIILYTITEQNFAMWGTTAVRALDPDH